MEPGHGGLSAVETVHRFLESLNGREPRYDEVRKIRWALDELVAKITRLHQTSPACARVTLSEEVLRLVRMAHGDGWLRIAALF